jgi:acetylornithine deacetylase/succinyl-diaminopimelate desuccinylase-like protein
MTLTALLAIPNVTEDRENIQRNAAYISHMMQMRGLSPRRVSVTGANPVVFGELGTPGALRTIVCYAHYDGQPFDPKEWTTPPCTPTCAVRQSTMAARSSHCRHRVRRVIQRHVSMHVRPAMTRPRSSR